MGQMCKMGLLMLDVFTKWATVIPLDSNKPIPLGNAILKVVEHMGKQLEILFSDSEGSLFDKY